MAFCYLSVQGSYTAEMAFRLMSRLALDLDLALRTILHKGGCQPSHCLDVFPMILQITMRSHSEYTFLVRIAAMSAMVTNLAEVLQGCLWRRICFIATSSSQVMSPL